MQRSLSGDRLATEPSGAASEIFEIRVRHESLNDVKNGNPGIWFPRRPSRVADSRTEFGSMGPLRRALPPNSLLKKYFSVSF